MKIRLICLIFIAHGLFSLTLEEKLIRAETGTYVVTEQNELVSLLHLHSKKNHLLLFEEISIPLHQAKNIQWAEWIQQGAPGHTSWILYEVDTEKKCVVECYSLSRKAWISTEEMNAFFIPLISLELNLLSEKDRLQKGATARPGNIGSRPWGPPQIKNGKQITDPQYEVYTAKWPIDSTDLSGKHIVLYFDKNDTSFPFPYWLQIHEGAVKFKMRAVDSGKNLSSPYIDIPEKTISFNGTLHHKDDKFYLTLNVPVYYDILSLHAVDLTNNPKTTHTLPFDIKRNEERLTILIDEEKINRPFIHGHEYLWIVIPKHSESQIESPFIYTHNRTAIH